jgi:hypothetical protein
MVSSRSLTADLNKFSALSRGERQLLMEAFLLLPAIHLGLRLLGYSRMLRMIERWTPRRSAASKVLRADETVRAGELARLIAIAAERGLYKATCLRRSLLLWWFLRKEGITGTLRFGVRTSSGTLEAHAWVECHGIVVNDAPDVRERYPTLRETLPATRLGL